MALPHAEKLIERARRGERLGTKDRRHCISFLMTTQPDATNVEMGQLFQVTERAIRIDKKYIREERAKLIKQDDIGLVIADIAMSFDNQVRDIEKSKRKCKLGGRPYLEHCKAIFNLQLQKVKALQELGYYPKNLGNMTVEKFEYKAIVGKDGSVNTRAIEGYEEDDAIDAEFEEVRQKQLTASEHDAENETTDELLPPLPGA
jgi:hypothetical protein